MIGIGIGVSWAKQAISVVTNLLVSFKARVASYPNSIFEAEPCLAGQLTELNRDGLLNSASLVITPNAYNEGVLYDVVPNTTLGDMNVVRATTATRVNSEGFVEEVPYNLLTYSEDFSNISWSKNNASVTANTAISPSGLMNADSFIGDGTIAFHILSQSGSAINGTIYTTTIYAKKNTNSFIQIVGTGTIYTNATTYANFDLNLGVVGSVGAGTSATITNVGNGWYRCTMTATATATVTFTGSAFLLSLITSATSPRGEQNTLSTSVYIWGAQLVQGSVPKDYFPTTDRLNVPRLNYDVAGGCPSILLEPQRTNLATYSDKVLGWAINSVTSPPSLDNQGISPNNTNSAWKIPLNATSRNQKNIDILANTNTYSWSCYVKALSTDAIATFGTTGINAVSTNSPSFNFSTNVFSDASNGTVTNVGNGWYRLSQSYTNNGTGIIFIVSVLATLSTNDKVLFWGLQLEQGAYPTSYIPTVASTVTRNADVISRNNIYTNGLITSAGGTWFVELDNNFSLTRDAGTLESLCIQTSSIATDNAFVIRNTSQGRLYIIKRIATIETGLYITLTNNVKFAIKWNGVTADVFVNGVEVVSATPFTTTLMEYLKGTGSDVPKYIKSQLLFPTPLSDSECIQLTTL